MRSTGSLVELPQDNDKSTPVGKDEDEDKEDEVEGCQWAQIEATLYSFWMIPIPRLRFIS